MTLTRPDTDVLQHLDWTPACEWQSCPAGKPPATHMTAAIKCGCTRLLCSVCAQRMIAGIANAAYISFWGCNVCDTFWGMGALRDFVILEPLP